MRTKTVVNGKPNATLAWAISNCGFFGACSFTYNNGKITAMPYLSTSSNKYAVSYTIPARCVTNFLSANPWLKPGVTYNYSAPANNAPANIFTLG